MLAELAAQASIWWNLIIVNRLYCLKSFLLNKLFGLWLRCAHCVISLVSYVRFPALVELR